MTSPDPLEAGPAPMPAEPLTEELARAMLQRWVAELGAAWVVVQVLESVEAARVLRDLLPEGASRQTEPRAS